MSIIKSGTTNTTAYSVDANTNGDLVFIVSESLTAMSITAAGAVSLPTSSLTITSGATLNGGVVVNEDGADVDFRVEGDTDANLIFADASADFVGIGTSTPATKLDVSGRAQFVNNGFNYVLVDSTASDSYFRLASAGTVKWYLRNNTANTNALEITPDAGSTTGLFLTQSGNVGIGTSSPTYKLQVEAATGPTIASVDTTNSVTTVINSSNTAGVVGTASNHPLAILTNGVEKVRVTDTGNVGIGTSSPGARVEIAGGNLLYAPGVYPYSHRAGPIGVALSATVTLFDLWNGGEGRGQYLVSVTRAGGSTGTHDIAVVGSSSSSNSYLYDVIASNGSIVIGVSGSNVTLTNNSGSSLTVSATAVPLVIEGN